MMWELVKATLIQVTRWSKDKWKRTTKKWEEKNPILKAYKVIEESGKFVEMKEW